MKVKMNTTAADPRRVLKSGKVYNLPSDEAKRFIDGGYAETAPPMAVAQRLTKPDPGETEERQEEEEMALA